MGVDTAAICGELTVTAAGAAGAVADTVRVVVTGDGSTTSAVALSSANRLTDGAAAARIALAATVAAAAGAGFATVTAASGSGSSSKILREAAAGVAAGGAAMAVGLSGAGLLSPSLSLSNRLYGFEAAGIGLLATRAGAAAGAGAGFAAAMVSSSSSNSPALNDRAAVVRAGAGAGGPPNTSAFEGASAALRRKPDSVRRPTIKQKRKESILGRRRSRCGSKREIVAVVAKQRRGARSSGAGRPCCNTGRCEGTHWELLLCLGALRCRHRPTINA